MNLIKKDILFHIGTLDIISKNKFSLEGDGLSVSEVPESWQKIAKLNGNKFKLSNNHSLFADFYSTDANKIIEWANNFELIKFSEMFKYSYFDDELEQKCYILFDNYKEALIESDYNIDAIESILTHIPTDKMKTKMHVDTSPMLLDKHLFSLYTKENYPDVDGVWFDDDLNELKYSAPAGMIFNHKLNNWKIKNLDKKKLKL